MAQAMGHGMCQTWLKLCEEMGRWKLELPPADGPRGHGRRSLEVKGHGRGHAEDLIF